MYFHDKKIDSFSISILCSFILLIPLSRSLGPCFLCMSTKYLQWLLSLLARRTFENLHRWPVHQNLSKVKISTQFTKEKVKESMNIIFCAFGSDLVTIRMDLGIKILLMKVIVGIDKNNQNRWFSGDDFSCTISHN